MHLYQSIDRVRACVLVVLLSCSTYASAGAGNIVGAWVQYTAGGVEARVVTHGQCPEITVDDKAVAMQQRAGPTEGHNNKVCVFEVPVAAQSLKLGDRIMPLPVNKPPNRIVVMGDTGCRLSAKHGLYQECNNNSLWPFAQVAKSVGEAEPDVILYTGDYIYRESPCPEGDKGCEGSPYGDTEQTWKADWLNPAKPVHQAAPLVLIRGNHETCGRAGHGWFRYLDAHPYSPGECLESTNPWIADLEALQVAVMDVASLKHGKTSLDKLFADQLHELDKQLTKPAWITAHRTFWGYGADDDSGELTMPTSELQSAVKIAGLPEKTRLLIGAHIHLAEVIDFGDQRPPQLVVANGGTQLVPRVSAPQAIDGVEIQSQQVFYQYGFVVMDSMGRQSWTISFRDREGRELERCVFDGKRVSCPEG